MRRALSLHSDSAEYFATFEHLPTFTFQRDQHAHCAHAMDTVHDTADTEQYLTLATTNVPVRPVSGVVEVRNFAFFLPTP